MEKVKIVTTSTCQLPVEIIRKYDIEVVPLYVNFGDQVYAERVDITDNEFYERVRKGELPQVSSPSTEDFVKVYKPLVEEGYSIISPLISSGLSGTINAAETAKKMLGNPDIYIFDSYFDSLGLGYQALEIAKELYDKKISKEEVIKELPSIRDRANLFLIVGDLHYLARIGRLSAAKALLGSAIKTVPLLYFKNGAPGMLERPRTMKRAKRRMIELTKEIVAKDGLKYMGIMWGDNREEAEEYRKSCEKEFGMDVSLLRMSPVTAAALGPRVLMLVFFTER